MNKTIYLILLSVVTIICILLGSIYHLSGWFLPDSKLGGTVETYEGELEAFDSIKIDADIADVKLETGDTYSLSYECSSELVPEVTVEHNTLTLTQPNTPHNWKNWKKINKAKCKITLTLPSDAVIDEGNIYSSVGNITIKDMQAKDMTLEASVGEINLSSCTFQHSDFTANVGNLETEDCDLGNGKVTADVGNISLSHCSFTNLDVTNSTGNISLDTALDLTNYDISMSTDFGSLTINGDAKKKSFAQAAKDSSTTNKLTIENSLGNIDVDY